MQQHFERWCRAWRLLGAGKDPGPLFNKMADAYLESGRDYHGISLVESRLAEFDAKHVSYYTHSPYVELGIWYQDLVFDPRSDDSRDRSAAEAYADTMALIGGELGHQKGEYLRSLVLMTKHQDKPANYDGELIADIDLRPLANEWKFYRRNVRRIRKELMYLSRKDFKKKRIEFLRGILFRQDIYWTPVFRKYYEEAARENMTRELEDLKTDRKKVSRR